jgi:predicted HicB family RNase H-like nuclease
LQLQYKTYVAEVVFSAVNGCFYGEIIDLKCMRKRDTVIFLAAAKHKLQEAMDQSIEQYLQQNSEVNIS